MSRPCPADSEGRMTAEAADTIIEAAKRASAVAIGPGLGRSDGTREIVRILLDRLDVPVVLDADGLWALAGHLEWVFSRDAGTVLTPHAGELGASSAGRRTGCPHTGWTLSRAALTMSVRPCS